MKKIKILSLVLLAVVITFSSCKVNTENSKEKLDDGVDNIVKQIELINDTEFRNAAFGILGTGTNGIDFKNSLKAENIIKIKELSLGIRNSLLDNYPSIFNKKLGNQEFSLSEYAGTYSWNNSTEEWDYADNSSSVIVLFPSLNNTSNDCKFEWSKYEEVKTNNDYYYPSVIYATLSQDDNEIALVDVEIEYNLDTEIPIDGKVIFELGKLKLNTEWTFKDKILKVDVSLKKGMTKINEIETELVFSSHDMDELISGEGFIKMHDIENSGGLKITFNFDNVDDMNSCSDFNRNVEIVIYTLANRRIGEVECDEDDDCGFIIVFNDGTTESVCTYFEKLEEAIENILIDIFDDLEA